MTSSKQPNLPTPDIQDRSGLRMRAVRRQPTPAEWLSAMILGLKRRSASLGVEYLTSTPELLVIAAGDGAADRFGRGWSVHVEEERGELSLVRRDVRSSYWFSFELLSFEGLADGVTRIKDDLKRLAKTSEPNAYAVGLAYASVKSTTLVKTLQTREALEMTTSFAKASVGGAPLCSDVVELVSRDMRCWVQLVAWCATEVSEPSVSDPRISVVPPPPPSG